MTKTPPHRPSTIVSTGNIFAAVAKKTKDEQFTQLVASEHVRIERIVSRGQAGGPDDWYDEEEAEWVLVIAGAARLVFEGESEARALGPGDYAYIPSRRRHRVDWTDPNEATIWVAVHFR